ncbi:lipocalin family protein [Mariniflexile sp. AS56]|uniref:lipocalin family protein n=1 Tax=Mariniflexile sp. AS56 TaxID=3063957 RepID=UPI0026EDC845|nr:lipocalin family protein [Mariniflexile sp. AS56]MDO7172261.1 lipocalin family protein [Mariniflexile sp. AS56]
MKKLILLCVAISVLSCGASKTVRVSNRVIKGDWVLSSITYNKPGTFNTTLLNDASKACFEGSTWQFIPNNNTGLYTINDTSCATGERNFIFNIQEVDAETGLYDFLLKPTNAKHKSDTNQGFRLKLSALSDTDMQWQQTVNVSGSSLIINMNFSKQ